MKIRLEVNNKNGEKLKKKIRNMLICIINISNTATKEDNMTEYLCININLSQQKVKK